MEDLVRRANALQLCIDELLEENTALSDQIDSLTAIHTELQETICKIEKEAAAAVRTVKKIKKRSCRQGHQFKEFANGLQDDEDKMTDENSILTTTDGDAADSADADNKKVKSPDETAGQEQKSDDDATTNNTEDAAQASARKKAKGDGHTLANEVGSAQANKSKAKAHFLEQKGNGQRKTMLLRSACGYISRRGCSFYKQQWEEISKAVLRNCQDGLKQIQCPLKGRGVVADKPFAKGDFVVEYRGELIDRITGKLREEAYAQDPDVGCFLYFFEANGKHYCVDATAETPHLGRLVNHSAKKPNLTTKVIYVNETPRLILIACRSISVDEELLFDYGDRSSSAIAANPWLTKS